VVGFFEGLGVKFFKVFFQLLKRPFLDDVVAIEIYYRQKGFLDNFKAPMCYELLPDKDQIGKV
jgi:hypothetical protein